MGETMQTPLVAKGYRELGCAWRVERCEEGCQRVLGGERSWKGVPERAMGGMMQGGVADGCNNARGLPGGAGR